MDSGREKFRKYKKIINFSSFILRIFTKKKQEKLFNKFNRGEGKFKLFFRYCILKNLCKLCGDNVFIGEYVTIKHFENLSLGDNVSIHKFSYIDATGEVIIKNDVSIATSCKLFSFNHGYEDSSKPIKYNDLVVGKIVIENDVWIGADSIILKDVTINSRVVIGAKSVVNKSVESKSIYAGIPAKLIKKIR